MSKAKFDPAADNRRWMLYVVFVIVTSWIGLWGITHLEVSSSTIVLFYALLFVAVTATMIPPIAYLNARFGRIRKKNVYRMRFVRQSVWVGVCAVLIAWLQSRRVLSLLLGFILAAVFILVETFLITREGPQSLR
jgi:hypothetical protein